MIWHRQKNGQAQLEQLGLLDAMLKEIADDLLRGDAEDLTLNGRVQEERFRGGQFPG